MDCANYCHNYVPVCFPVLYWIWSSVTKFIFIVARKYSTHCNADELTIGMQGSWSHFNVRWLEIIGWFLYVPATFFVFGAIATLQHKGKPVGEMTETTTIVTTGIYGLIRQPMTFGMFI